jgi:hypothetical protein
MGNRREEFFKQAEKRLTRNLSLDELRRYFGNEPYRRTRADLESPVDTQG